MTPSGSGSSDFVLILQNQNVSEILESITILTSVNSDLKVFILLLQGDILFFHKCQFFIVIKPNVF